MPAFIVPAYVKPYSRILTWIVPMAYIDEEEIEYISETPNVYPFYKNYIIGYKKYDKLVLSKDIQGHAERFKVVVDITTKFQVPVEEFVKNASRGHEYTGFKAKANLLDSTGNDFIGQVYNSLDRDLRPVISTPTQWLVYYRNEKILTRMCWVVSIEGEVVVRPYGARGILLEVDNIKLDKVNEPSLRQIKRNTILRQRLNDYWKRLVASEQALEEAQNLVAELEGTETGAEEVGEIE